VLQQVKGSATGRGGGESSARERRAPDSAWAAASTLALVGARVSGPEDVMTLIEDYTIGLTDSNSHKDHLHNHTGADNSVDSTGTCQNKDPGSHPQGYGNGHPWGNVDSKWYAVARNVPPNPEWSCHTIEFDIYKKQAEAFIKKTYWYPKSGYYEENKTMDSLNGIAKEKGMFYQNYKNAMDPYTETMTNSSSWSAVYEVGYYSNVRFFALYECSPYEMKENIGIATYYVEDPKIALAVGNPFLGQLEKKMKTDHLLSVGDFYAVNNSHCGYEALDDDDDAST